MLSEAYALLRNLNETGFDIPIDHGDVKKPGKNPGYRVGLGDGGVARIVEELDGDSMGNLWYHREGKMNAFPVLKVQHALFSVPNDDPVREKLADLKRTDQKQRIKLLREVIDQRELQFSDHDKQTWVRLRSKAQQWLDIFGKVDEQYVALPLMLQRFVNTEVSPEDLLISLSSLIVERLEQGRLENVALAEKLLVGILDQEMYKKPAKAEIPLVIDVAETNCPIVVADPKMSSYVIRLLRAREQRDPDGICALEGEPRPLLKRRFPEPNIGDLGETKLFSKNKDTPCEFRYLKNSSDWEDASKSFPVGQWIAVDTSAALKVITSQTLRGKTWRMVANGKWDGKGRNKREKKDLLIVYCEGQPIISDQAADFFGSDELERRDQFERDSEALCRALDGIIKHRPLSRLHLMLIGRADKEKKQVLMHLSPTAQEVLTAAERWKRAVWQNLPTVRFPLLSEEKGQSDGKGPIFLEVGPHPPYPDRVVRLLSSAWVRGGSDELKLQGPALRQVLDFMLRATGKWQEAAQNLLDLAVQRVGPLLVGIAGAFRTMKREEIEQFKQAHRIAALRAVALFGILLDALGRERGIYMKDTAFQLGRLLALSDTLHREYCLHERRRSIPPQLIGNALMSAAANNPEDAIDRLRERMSIYQAWATKGDDEEHKLAKWALSQIGHICQTIERPLPTNADQRFRAELFLGYMARTPK
jgi:hypothetical protein